MRASAIPSPGPPPGFGARVAQALAAAVGDAPGMQSRAARRFGVSRVSVHSWVQGRCYPEVGRLVAICEAAGCTTDWVLIGRGGPPAPAADAPVQEAA